MDKFSIESWFLSDKEKNYDTEWFSQNTEQFFDTVANLLKLKDEKTISKVSSKLTNLYKDKENKYQHLVINCIPALLKYYFLFFYDEKNCSPIEVCILTIYNLSLSDEHIKLSRTRVPNLSLPSVYHLPQSSTVQSELTESALSKHETEYVIVEEQFTPILDTINVERRFSLIKYLLLLYHSRLSTSISKQSKLYFCDMCLKICKINRAVLKIQPIYLNSTIYNQMLYTLFYLFNNNQELDAYIAIEAISAKADEEMLPEVLLMANSIKNLIQQSKIEPGIQNALINAASLESSKRRASVTSFSALLNNPNNPNRKKSTDTATSSPVNYHRGSTAVSSIAGQTGVAELMNSNSSLSTNLNDVHISPSAEIRQAARRASIKQQQMKSSTESSQMDESDSVDSAIITAPVIPPLPPPLSAQPTPTSDERSLTASLKLDNDRIPNIDETSGENDDENDSDLREKL